MCRGLVHSSNKVFSRNSCTDLTWCYRLYTKKLSANRNGKEEEEEEAGIARRIPAGLICRKYSIVHSIGCVSEKIAFLGTNFLFHTK